METKENRPVIVLGAKGQVGRALLLLLGDQAIGFTKAEADLKNPESIVSHFNKIEPRAVINAAAYTAVDLAEENELAATQRNGIAPGLLAAWCSQKNIPFIHYSTDYVFSGEGAEPWKEEDLVSPLNAYGRTKLEGEKLIEKAGGKYLILRTSWVYDATGKNFLKTMLRLGKEKEKLQIVSDQFGAPTYAGHLAQGTLDALKAAEAKAVFSSGIYHLANTGVTSWCDFAKAIFDRAREKGISLQVKEVEGIASAQFPTQAKRPLNSRLSQEKIKTILGIQLPDWKQGLRECMEQLQ